MNNWYNEDLDFVANREEINKLLPDFKKDSYSHSFPRVEQNVREQEGWHVTREFKTTVRMERKKEHYELFENKVWTLFACLGFQYLNTDKYKFRLEISETDEKQIDVFGIDEDIVILAECKSAKNPHTKTGFRQEIAEIAQYKSLVGKRLNSHFKTKPKYIFFFCTSNYDVNEEDQARMKASDIVWLDNKKIEYFTKLSKDLGILAKYQFFGEILKGKNIPNMSEIKVPAIKAKLGRYVCYAMMIEPKKLLKICFVLHRTEYMERKNTYQRYVNKNRITQIKKYIEEGGFFPNSIIINFDSTLYFTQAPQSAQSNDKCTLGTVTLPPRYKSAFIIDGQHRLYGFAGTESQETSVIPVVAFEKVAAEDQTKMFVDINNKAVAVKRDLIESLNSELFWNSDDAKYALAALNSMLAIELTDKPSSPLHDCIMFGEKEKKQTSKLTLTYFIDNALRNEKFFVKEFHKNRTPLKYGPLYDGDLADRSLAKGYFVLSSFFSKVKESCPSQWDALLTNVGIASLSQLLCEFLDEYESKQEELSKAKAKDVISAIAPRIELFCKELATQKPEDLERYQDGKLGYGGVSKFKPYLERIVYSVDNSFAPNGLEQWIVEQSGQYTDSSRQIIETLTKTIVQLTYNKLIESYGETDYIYSLPQKVLLEIQKRKQKNPSRENCLEIEDIQSIVKTLWKDVFEPVLGDKSKSGDKEKRTEYLDKIVRIKAKLEKGEMISENEYTEVYEIKKWFIQYGLLTEQISDLD